MNTAFLSLGGNIGDRKANLLQAITDIERSCGRIVRRSAIYETEPWGLKSDAAFLNMAVKLETALTHEELLEKILIVEKKLGRSRHVAGRGGDKYTDRTIDIDILFYNRKIYRAKHLHIPHPRIELRKFVLVPLKEIDPEFIHPTLKKSIRVLLKNCTDTLKVNLYKEQPALRFICVEGNIGSGKTTFAKALAKRLKGFYLEEKFEKNNLVPLFYKDPKLYAFPLEYFFLISRYEQISNCFKENHRLVIADYSFFRSLIFAKTTLSKNEYAFFKKHFHALEAQLPRPELAVYMHTDIENLAKNILNRKRPYELDIKKSYLEALQAQYDRKINKVAVRTVPLHIKNYNAELEKNELTQIEKYVKENFGGQGAKD